MKYIEKTEYKPFGVRQTNLFENRQTNSRENEGMPNWFWRLAKECKRC